VSQVVVGVHWGAEHMGVFRGLLVFVVMQAIMCGERKRVR